MEENNNQNQHDENIKEEQSNELQFKSRIDLSFVNDIVNNIRNEAAKHLIGQQKLVDLMIAAVFAGGHVLIEGVPGIAKTLTAKIISRTMDCAFQRIQFTPDLMPSDVLGTSVFNPKANEFEFKKGPVFSNVVLIDEINRAPAKTQAALFEVMEEKQVTIDGKTYKFNPPFIVFATQNPIEHEGTYNLPEAQVDRFLFKLIVEYPDLEQEMEILDLKNKGENPNDLNDIQAVIRPEDLLKIQKTIEKVHVEKKLMKYIAEIIYNTRNNHDLYLGASPRASIALLYSAKVFAAMNGRDFVIPEDIQFMAHPVLNHRIIPTPEKEMEGVTIKDIIENIINKV